MIGTNKKNRQLLDIVECAEMPTAPILSEVFRFLHSPSDITIT